MMGPAQPSREEAISFNQPYDESTEVARLRRENQELRDRLTRLSEASLRIIESIDFDAVIQEVIDGARSLTGARYGALLTYDDTGGIRDFITSGITPEQLKLMKTPPEGWGFLDT